MKTICTQEILPYFKINDVVEIKQESFETSSLNFDMNWGRTYKTIKGELSFTYNNKIIYERFIRNIINNQDIKNYFKPCIN